MTVSRVEGLRALRTCALVLALLALAEALARIALAPIGGYWEYWTPAAAPKFETYRAAVARGRVPQLVVVGDSTAARDIDPAALVGVNGSTDTLNLAWPANFPRAFKECTLPLLRSQVVPAVVVASFSTVGFLESPRVRQFEDAILAAPYCRRARGERITGDVSYLARVRPAMPFRRSWWTGRSLPALIDLGFMPVDPISGPNAIVDVPEDVAADFSRARFGALEELVRVGGARGFQVAIILPPRRHASPPRGQAEQQYREALDAAGFRYLDYRQASFVRDDDFFDDAHLNGSGAQRFSKQLAKDLQRLLAAGGENHPSTSFGR